VKVIVLDEWGRPLFSSFGPARALPESVTRQAGQRTAGHFEWSDGSAEYIATHWSLFLQSTFSTPKWTIVLNQSKTDVLAPIAHFKRTFLLVIILTVLMVLLLSVRQIRKSLTPLERLQEGTRRLALGDLDARVEVASHDEFQDLAGSFNLMAGQLRRQFNALEMRREISAALSPHRPLEEALQACAEILARQLDLATVGFWTIESDDAPLQLRASVEPSRAEGAAPAWTPMTEAMVGRIARERRSYATNSPLEDLLPPRLQRGAGEDPVAFVGHPLVVDDHVVGVVAAFATHALDGMDLTGFGAAAGDIGRYVDRTRVENALHESEEQLRQLQKMEAVGRLAGGIAHDFNNLLTVILGRSRLLLEAMTADHPHRRSVRSIDETAERAALLTRQLLAFSRKQVLAPAILDLNEVAVGLTDLLQRLIGESVELIVNPGTDVGHVKVDRGQLEQVIVNLVVNARDAMPQGGRITIDTSAAGPDEPGAAPGSRRQARLAVTDTGTGMDAHTRARIFEPFFTTKEPGKGTGLGLATVYGIIRQSGGSIQVESELGAGTTFTISLPRVEESATTGDTPSTPAGRGSETVLIVEDEPEVRALVHAVLVDHGYLVLSAGLPSEAVELAERHPGPIHLLLTDMVMPGMGGPALARRILAGRPLMAVLYMSGYTDHTVEDGSLFLQKPFTPDTIARAVRAALDAVTRTAISAVPNS
jgi:signal transduction histidine kinase/CheY-like chemotaxis protein/HAMP domain-containing protein